MPPNFTHPSSTPNLLEGILNASFHGIIAYEAVRDQSGTIIDFRAVTINRMAQQILQLPDTEPGWQLLIQFPGTIMNDTFARYVRVTETGKPDRFEIIPLPGEDSIWYDVSVVKMGDGFVATFNNISVQRNSAQMINEQNEMMRSILNTSLSSVIIHEAIRDDSGQIQDFRLLLLNPKAESEIRQMFPHTADNRTLLGINPRAREEGHFDRYKQVIETGQSTQQEDFYPDSVIWYDTTIAKLGDGVVITATNITTQKEIQQQLEQQAALTQAMIDGSLNGLLLLEPIVDAHQTIVDFAILAANQSVEQLTGVSPSVAVGNRMRTIYPGFEEAGYFGMYVRVLQTGKAERIETYYHDEKGLTGWFELSAVRQAQTVVVTFTNTTKFRLAEQQLKRAADNLQAVIDNSQTGIFVFSPVHDQAGEVIDFRFKTINKTVAALIGQTPDAIRGDLASNWFISYRDTETYTRYKTTLATGEDQRFDTNYKVDGLDVWFDVHSVKLGDDVLVTFTDYSGLKRAQLAAEKLALETAQTASLLDSVLNNSINGIMSFESIRSKDGTITDFRFKTINEASERIIGIPVQTMMAGETLIHVFPGNIDSGLFAKYVHTTETGEPTRAEVEYQADGLDFWLDVSAQRLGDGFVVTFTDTSLIKRASRVIEQSAAELQTVIDNTNAGIFLIVPVWDDTGGLIDFRLRVANRVVAAFAGQTPEALIGGLGSVWFPDYMTNGLFDRYKHTYLTGETQQFESYYESDTLSAWTNVLATKMGDQVLVTFSDFTELKKLQQQLESSVIDLQRSNKNLEQFAYVASHDLQEPLRKIQQFGDILQTSYGPVLGESGQDMLSRMQLAAERMRILIKDVLAYSRIAIKRESAKAIDLNQLLRDVTGDLETAILEKNALIQIDTLPTITGDSAQLRQLFQNLISNSLKFTKPGRRPELQLRYTVQRGRDTDLPVSPGDNMTQFYRFELSDNGIGFDAHQAEKIFQVFQRLHSRSEYQGTGIGLAIVQKVVENHRGYIRAEGQPGQGATFTVLLPT